MLEKEQSWIEKYRAALIETNPQRQLDRIEEAVRAMQGHAQEPPAGRFEKEALEDARLILRLLREESLGRASSPWL
jgi:hypothetical protein